MTKQEWDALSVSEQQRKVQTFTDQNIIYCASMLVSGLSGATQEGHIEALADDACIGMSSRDDWEEPALNHIAGAEREELLDAVTELDLGGFGELNTDDELREGLQEAVSTEDGKDCEYCQFVGVEPCQVEALEHWIVSNWLADKLEAQGEMIDRDFLGLTIWGRTCSGQAIMLDYVIVKIYKDLFCSDEPSES